MYHLHIYNVSEQLFNKFATKGKMDQVEHIQRYFIQEDTNCFNIYRVTIRNNRLHLEMEKVKKDKVVGELGYEFNNHHSRERFLANRLDSEIFDLIMTIDTKRGFKYPCHFEKVNNWGESMRHIAGDYKMVG